MKYANSTLIGVALGLQCSLSMAHADYLPIVGPKPLWFGPAAPPVAVVSVALVRLPPLKRDDTRTSSAGSNSKKDTTDAGASIRPSAPNGKDPNSESSVLGPLPKPSEVEIVTTLRPNLPGLPVTLPGQPVAPGTVGFPVLPPPHFESDSAPPPLLSPQMLLPFFQTSPSTGTNRLSVTLPLIFTPALPPGPASSSATYEQR